MLKNKARLWNAVRSLRGKKDKLSESSQDDSDSTSANVEELDSDSELEKRVKRWLSESFPPHDSRSSASCIYYRQNQNYDFDSSLHMDGTVGDIEQAETGVLYHPDFADWAAIQDEKRRPDDLLHVFDEATASLSKLLSAPFGRG